VLFKHGIAKGKSLTSYPTVKSDIESFYQYKEDSTVVDGKNKYFIQPYKLFSLMSALIKNEILIVTSNN